MQPLRKNYVENTSFIIISSSFSQDHQECQAAAEGKSWSPAGNTEVALAGKSRCARVHQLHQLQVSWRSLRFQSGHVSVTVQAPIWVTWLCSTTSQCRKCSWAPRAISAPPEPSRAPALCRAVTDLPCADKLELDFSYTWMQNYLHVQPVEPK